MYGWPNYLLNSLKPVYEQYQFFVKIKHWMSRSGCFQVLLQTSIQLIQYIGLFVSATSAIIFHSCFTVYLIWQLIKILTINVDYKEWKSNSTKIIEYRSINNALNTLKNIYFWQVNLTLLHFYEHIKKTKKNLNLADQNAFSLIWLDVCTH